MEETVKDGLETTPASSEVEVLRVELAEAEARFLRLHADMENMRRRLQREKEEIWHFALADCLAKLLPVLDNLQRAVAALPDSTWGQGVVLVSRQLEDVLAKYGLEPIAAAGLFDPQYHEAIMQDGESAEPENTITAVLERGYLFKGRVLRPSKVKVSMGGCSDE
ncbi:MAG: Protein GrpE [Firmicutes bacterium]|nr:Protein GrpE [candidate division NPL-UPA2 bacterium]